MRSLCKHWLESVGNYELCTRTKKIIKRILDQVLETSPPSRSLESNPVSGLAPPELTITSMLAPEEEPDFLEWLNSVDWTRDVLQDAWT